VISIQEVRSGQNTFGIGFQEASLLGNFFYDDSENGKVRAVQPAQTAPGASFRLYGARRVISFAVKLFRELKHLGRTEGNAKTAAFAQFQVNRHQTSRLLLFNI
jgi:hypothetical protein